MTYATIHFPVAALTLRNPHTLVSGKLAMHSEAGDIHVALDAATPAELRDLAQRLVLHADQWETEIAEAKIAANLATVADEVTS